MLASRVQDANDFVVGVDVWLWTVPLTDQTGGRNLRLWFDAAQVLSKPTDRGHISGLRRSRAMIGAHSKFKRELGRNLTRPLCLQKRDEDAETRFDSPKLEPQSPAQFEVIPQMSIKEVHRAPPGQGKSSSRRAPRSTLA